MIDIHIDGSPLDSGEGGVVALNLEVNCFSDLETTRTGYTGTLTVPNTVRNRQAFGNAHEVNSPERFNDTAHTATISCNGSTVFSGKPYLLSVIKGNGGSFTFCIVGPGKQWADHAAAVPLRDAEVEFEENITAAMVKDSWTWEKPVRFLPVQRDGFAVDNPASNILKPVKVLTFGDYHPFIHVRSLLEQVFKSAGYSIASDFIASPYFGSLYISGNYPRKDTDAIRRRMDFLAGRFSDSTATADSNGRVYATPYRGSNTVGNIVESADPKEERDGATIEGVYNTNDCFRMDDQRISFVPPSEVTCSFEYRIYYTTEYYMTDRYELKGFNTVNLDDGQLRKFKIANRNTDRRDSFRTAKEYLLIVFAHLQGSRYRLCYSETKAGVSTIVPGPEFASRTTKVAVSSTGEVSAPLLQYYDEGAGQFAEYTGDWAIYDGYVGERGRVDVELKVRSSAERLLPSSPKFFDVIFLGGAEPGMALKIWRQTTVRPVFEEFPGEGSTVTFGQVAAHEVSCLDFINSLKHLFNLQFYTDEIEKKVFIEPFGDFYAERPILDWRGKLDAAMAYKICEPGDDLSRELDFRYMPGDGAVSRRNILQGETLGSWVTTVCNHYAAQGIRTIANPMYTASISGAGDYPDAPQALLIQAGNRDAEAAGSEDNLNFPAKIVHYHGLEELPQGQLWGWPANQSTYPLLGFSNGEYTLCFEDRDGMRGLNRFRTRQMEFINNSKRLVAWLHLTADDIGKLMFPDSQKNDFRARIRLKIGGDDSVYRLEKVEGYRPGYGKPAKCTFLKEV